MIKEKATGEMYASKKAMAKHEKGEGAKMRKMEKMQAGSNKKAPCKMCGSPMKMASKPPMKTISHPPMKTPAGVKTKMPNKAMAKSPVKMCKK